MTFNENVKQDTLNFNNIKLTKKGTTDQNVTGLTLTKKANSFTLKPNQDLELDTKYELSVKDIEDLSGNKMGERVVKFGRLTPPEITEFSYTGNNVFIKFDRKIQTPTETNFVLKQGDNVEFTIDTNNNPTIKLIGNFNGKYKLTIKDIKDLEDVTMQETEKTFQIYQTDSGIQKSFARDSITNVVTDNITNLKWKDDETVKTIEKTWQEVVEYCESLGTGWRLPEIWELNGVFDYDKDNATFDIFTNVPSEYYKFYWSNITVSDDESSAWTLIFGYNERNRENSKNNTYYVRCVQGEKQEATQNCNRNAEKKIVTCTDTKLEWQDDEAAGSRFNNKSWQEAKDYCENLELDGKGWRLPNINELLSIVDYKRTNPAIISAFTNITRMYPYWSSSSTASNSEAWQIFFIYNSKLGLNHKLDTNSIFRCVRTAD